MFSPYPLRLKPVFRDYLWGGRRLETVLCKALPAEGVWAESWEAVDHPEHQSVIENGPLAGQTIHQVASDDPTWLFGDGSISQLPLLLKYLDCQRVLSVQVHPDDAYGATMTPPDLGKTEAWYIIDAEPGAVIYAGLKKGVDAKQLHDAMADGSVEKCLHVVHPKPGDCYFIPAGTVHALGAGLLVAEIQQASNTTFRLYDWNRTDANGNPRALHTAQSLQVTDYKSGPRHAQTPQATSQPGRERLVECEKFTFDRIRGVDSCTVGGDGRFHLLTAPHGNVVLKSGASVETLKSGQSVLLPASLPEVKVTLDSQAELLDMYL